MKILTIIALAIAASFGMAEQHSTISGDSTRNALMDSIRSIEIASEDNAESTNLPQYFQLLAALLGSLLAGLIAYYSVRTTHKNNVKVEIDKAKRARAEAEARYSGVLFLILTELYIHQKDEGTHREMIDEFVGIAIELKTIISDAPFQPLPIESLRQHYKEFPKYEFFHTPLVSSISVYINAVERYNSFLNISRLRETIGRINEADVDFDGGVKGYFEEVVQALDGIMSGGTKIVEEIIDTLQNYELNELDPEKLKKSILG